jgi:uncharacterized membrane protein
MTAKKNNMGRPKIPAGERRKKFLGARFNDAEIKAMEAFVNAGGKKSELIRTSVARALKSKGFL